MQLFFILSGLFFSQSSVTSCFKKKIKQLIVPYIIFCIIGILLSLLIPQWRGFTYKDVLRDIYWGYPNAVNVSSVWFLVCLFVVTLVFNIILIIQKKNKLIGWAAFLVIVGFGFSLGRLPAVLGSFPAGRMPFDSDCACVALLFFGLGYYFRDKILSFGKQTSKKIGVCTMGSLASLAVTVIIAVLNGTVNLHGITYHNELLYICGALAGFFFVFFISLIIEKQKQLRNILIWFGKNSLKIMGAQAIVLRLYLLVINNISGNSYKLFFLPPLYAVLGCFVVTIISAGVIAAYNTVKNRFIGS